VATVHAQHHVIYAYGQIFSHIFEVPDPISPIHFTTCIHGSTIKKNWVICQNSLQRCLKVVALCMHKITWCLNWAVNLSMRSCLATSNLR